MFVDEITIQAKAGNGGNGVVRWLREYGRPWGGPAGGNGGHGGDVYLRAIKDNNVLSKYTGSKEFNAEHGEAGHSKSKYGKNGEDLYIDVPVGSVVTNLETKRTFELFEDGAVVKILSGGTGGLGNEYFKSSTNRAPEEHTPGREGESGTFRIEVELVVDAGLIGEPNAGKSTLLNMLTRATSRVASYPFTTLEPHLGDLYGFTLADIPGLIEGAASGKGLGHKFLRHVKRTRALIHCISLEGEEQNATYLRVRKELEAFDPEILKKEEWVILTKADLVDPDAALRVRDLFIAQGKRTYIISQTDPVSIKTFADDLVRALRSGEAL